MRKLIALGAVVLLMLLALAAESTPVGPDDADGQVFPGMSMAVGSWAAGAE